MFYVVLQILVPIFLIWHGYKLRFKTPPFNAERGGVNTWRTREGEKQWEIGNKASGVYCIIVGAVLGTAAVTKLALCGTEPIKAYNYAFGGVGLVLVFSMVPVAHAVINKELGVKGPKLGETHVPPAGTQTKRSSSEAPANALRPHYATKKKKKK